MVDSVGPLTLNDLWAWLSSARGDRPFLTFIEQKGAVRRATYRAFDDEINQMANLLSAHGVRPGENVILQLPSSVDFLRSMFALAKIGAVAVPINRDYQPQEVEHIRKVCAADAAIVVADKAEASATQTGLKTLFVAGDWPGERAARPDGAARTIGLGLCPGQPTIFTPDVKITSDTPAMMLFTSGTTAAPKGVVITHANCLHSGLYHNWQMAMTDRDRLLTTMPMEHSNFQLAGLMPVLTVAAELVVVQQYSASRFWRQVREQRATLIQAVATIVKTLLLQPVDPDETRHAVRDVQYYLTLDDDAKEQFERRFNTQLLNCYGLTETINWVITDFAHGPRRWPSIGRVGLGYQARVVDSFGHEAPAGEVGEIQIKGDKGRSMMLEYYRDPEATARAYTPDGWFRTGDRGYVDDDGWFFFTGRSSDIIKRAGRNISALEVEEQLLAHPGVAEAAVVGAPDEIRDEAVMAFVVPRLGETLDPAEVLGFVAGRIAAYKVPSEVIVSTDLPRTSTGKIAKRLLVPPAPESQSPR
ncbi:MAG: AMP-binding protein [Promicromonosporaceae bacterium]|nr:AMP-binding protein [Promicromonosporaceae bacterium]